MKGLAIGFGLLLFLCQTFFAQTQLNKESQAKEADPFIEYVSNLKKPDRIVIAAIRGKKKSDIQDDNSDTEKDLPEIKKLVSIELKDKDAEQLWTLWSGLKNGNGYGCFAPQYLLDFYLGEQRILRTQVCFGCCNVTIPNSGIRSICGDSESLKLFKEFLTKTLPYPKANSK